MTNFDSMFQEVEERTSSESDFFVIKTGKNTVRILSDFVKVENVFKGEYPNSKYQGIKTPERTLESDEKSTLQGWAWLLDRATGEVKIGQFGSSILKALGGLKNDPEYAFTSFPMPYDITITNTGEGANRYSIIAARQNTEVKEEEMTLLNKKKTIADIVGAIVDKQSGKTTDSVEAVDYPQSSENTSADGF